jgi:hypothetical protein
MRLLVWLTIGLSLQAASTGSAAEYAWVRSADGQGHFSCSAAAGWQQPGFDDSAWVTRATGDDAGSGCLGTAFSRFRFDVGPELSRIATVTLRIRYGSGFAAWLNGTEIARRRLDPNAEPNALANDFHGPEWERVFVPVKASRLMAHGNVLAVEVHTRSPGREPLLEVELGGADGVRIVRGPWLQRLSAREVTVLFDTDVPTVGEVRFGATEAYGSMVAEPAPQTHHALKLGGLPPGARVHYRVSARAPVASAQLDGTPVDVADSGDAVFHTTPEPGKPLRFVVYGDVRSPGHDVHALLNRQLAEEDPDFALITGDVVDRGSDEGDWEKFFDIAGPLLRGLTLFVAPGNHEYWRLPRGAMAYLQHFRLPLASGEEEVGWFSFDQAGVHFVSLDSNQYRSPRQLAWFAQDLADARKRGTRGVFVFAHEPPFSTGMHGDNQVAIHDYVPIMEKNKVSMFFGGHDHHYERGRVGTFDYVVTGGGGAELRAMKCVEAGKKPCPPHVLAVANEHNYVAVEVMPTFFRICPKRPDGTPIEACTELPLKR